MSKNRGKRQKSPKAGGQPRRNKQPRSRPVRSEKMPSRGASPESTNDETPAWQTNLIDHNGPWGFGDVEREHFEQEILAKLVSYERMTWGQILSNQQRNHKIAADSLIKPARDRLAELKLDDYEELFRFRLSGEKRLWGIRDGRAFLILWYDQNHEVCPSNKKHT